tara:strand:- start:1000 stop:1482 length:483 start_codon:yes stop_codon:yes gene_type:complete
MKKSELKEAIREEIISILSEASDEDVANQKALNDEMAQTKKAAQDINAELKEADDDDIKRQQDLNKELEATKAAADELEPMSDESPLLDEDEDEPTAAQLKGDSISTLASKLQDTSSELKSTSKKYKETTDEKEKAELMDRLKKLTAIKKEIESLLEHKK